MQEYEVPELPHAHEYKFVITVAQWNPQITTPLLEGALLALDKAGVPEKNVRVLRVPGSVELVNAAAFAMDKYAPDAIIMLGCVIRGETPHFDYVCEAVTRGMTELNLRGEAPVIFGLVTTNDEQQALDRAGGRLGNKGTEAAAAAITMARLHRGA